MLLLANMFNIELFDLPVTATLIMIVVAAATARNNTTVAIYVAALLIRMKILSAGFDGVHEACSRNPKVTAKLQVEMHGCEQPALMCSLSKPSRPPCHILVATRPSSLTLLSTPPGGTCMATLLIASNCSRSLRC